jgi:hypothetical protein
MRKNGKFVSTLVLTFLLLAGALVVLGPEEKIDAEASTPPWEGDYNEDNNLAMIATAHGGGGSGSPPYNIHQWNDGILSGQNAFIWCSGTGSDGAYGEYRWNEEVVIGAFRIYQFYATNTRTWIGCLDMQYWDGTQYVSLGGYHAADLGLYITAQPYTIVLPDAVVTTRFRLYGILGYQGQVSNPSISEWQVFEGFATETGMDVEIGPGFGEDYDVYPAQAGMGENSLYGG